jgi:hypothetical protein
MTFPWLYEGSSGGGGAGGRGMMHPNAAVLGSTMLILSYNRESWLHDFYLSQFTFSHVSFLSCLSLKLASLRNQTMALKASNV